MAVPGIFSPGYEAPGPSVDASQYSVCGQDLQVPADRSPGSATFGYQFINGDFLAVAQQLADEAVAVGGSHIPQPNKGVSI